MCININVCSVCLRRMGLAHVFAGGCTETNDGCDDTAQMSGPNYNCYLGGTLPNTCPGRPANQPKFDPVNKCAGCQLAWRLRLHPAGSAPLRACVL